MKSLLLMLLLAARAAWANTVPPTVVLANPTILGFGSSCHKMVIVTFFNDNYPQPAVFGVQWADTNGVSHGAGTLVTNPARMGQILECANECVSACLP